MKIISEDTVRQLLFKSKVTEISVDANTYVTKQAEEYIKDKGMTLVADGQVKIGKKQTPSAPEPPAAAPVNPDIKPYVSAQPEQKGRFVSEVDGSFFDHKPEHMTHLHGNVLVMKNHPRIVLRGKLDSLEAAIVQLQVKADRAKLTGLVQDLDNLLNYCRQVLGSEVTEKPLQDQKILGLDEGQLRKMSHDPKEYFGIGHVLPSYGMGEIGADLNALRTQSREVELAAINAFCKEGQVQREDLLQGLNRLSSAIYILLCRYLSNCYRTGK